MVAIEVATTVIALTASSYNDHLTLVTSHAPSHPQHAPLLSVLVWMLPGQPSQNLRFFMREHPVLWPEGS